MPWTPSTEWGIHTGIERPVGDTPEKPNSRASLGEASLPFVGPSRPEGADSQEAPWRRWPDGRILPLAQGVAGLILGSLGARPETHDAPCLLPGWSGGLRTTPRVSRDIPSERG